MDIFAILAKHRRKNNSTASPVNLTLPVITGGFLYPVTTPFTPTAYTGAVLVAASGTWSNATGLPVVSGQWWNVTLNTSAGPTGILTHTVTTPEAQGRYVLAWRETAVLSGQETTVFSSLQVTSAVAPPPTPVITTKPYLQGGSPNKPTGTHEAGAQVSKPGFQWVTPFVAGAAPSPLQITGQWVKNGTPTGVTASVYSSTVDGDEILWRESATNVAGTTTVDSQGHYTDTAAQLFVDNGSAEILSRISGLPGGAQNMDVFSSHNHASASYSRNPGLWAPDLVPQLTGVVAYKGWYDTEESYGGVLITEQNVLFCAHASPHPADSPPNTNPNPETRFVTQTSTVVDREMISEYPTDSDPFIVDLRVGTLNSPAPESVHVIPILQLTQKQMDIIAGKYKVLGVSQAARESLAHITPPTPASDYPQYHEAMLYIKSPGLASMPAPYSAFDYKLYVGDSGTPGFVLYKGVVYLLVIVTIAPYGGVFMSSTVVGNLQSFITLSNNAAVTRSELPSAPTYALNISTLAQAASAPVFLSNPLVSGSTAPGSVLTRTLGRARNSKPLTGQWVKNGVPTGVTSSTYSATASSDQVTWRSSAVNDVGTVTQDSATFNVANTVTAPPVFSVAPLVTGTTIPGATLTRTTGVVDTGTLTGQWYKNNIATGVTAETYNITVSGDTVFWRASSTNASGTTTSDSNVRVVIVVPVNSVVPVVSGLPYPGQVISTTNGTWTGTPTFTYQWQKAGVNIGGATGSTLVVNSIPSLAHLDLLRCTVTATNSSGVVTANSNALTTILLPANTVAPVVSGNPFAGQTLTTTTGTWINDPVTYTYQWRVAGVSIPGATNTTVVVPGTVIAGQAITCTVTATNAAGSTSRISSALSALTPPVFSAAPVISGLRAPGSILTRTLGTSTDSITGQWYKNNVATGVTTSTYSDTLAQDAIKWRSSATNASGTTTSDSNTITVLALPVNTLAPVASGTPNPGQVLYVSTGAWTGTPTFTYQWQKAGVNIGGATSNTLAINSIPGLVNLDLLRCRITATNVAGSTQANSNALQFTIPVFEFSTPPIIFDPATTLLSSTGQPILTSTGELIYL